VLNHTVCQRTVRQDDPCEQAFICAFPCGCFKLIWQTDTQPFSGGTAEWSGSPKTELLGVIRTGFCLTGCLSYWPTSSFKTLKGSQSINLNHGKLWYWLASSFHGVIKEGHDSHHAGTPLPIPSSTDWNKLQLKFWLHWQQQCSTILTRLLSQQRMANTDPYKIKTTYQLQ